MKSWLGLVAAGMIMRLANDKLAKNGSLTAYKDSRFSL